MIQDYVIKRHTSHENLKKMFYYIEHPILLIHSTLRIKAQDKEQMINNCKIVLKENDNIYNLNIIDVIYILFESEIIIPYKKIQLLQGALTFICQVDITELFDKEYQNKIIKLAKENLMEIIFSSKASEKLPNSGVLFTLPGIAKWIMKYYPEFMIENKNGIIQQIDNSLNNSSNNVYTNTINEIIDYYINTLNIIDDKITKYIIKQYNKE